MTKSNSHTRIFGETIRLSVILLFTIVISLLLFGKRIFESWDYVIITKHNGTITLKGWYLIAGIFLLLTQVFFFMRERYHGFRRESMNYVCLFITLLLLAYVLHVYYFANALDNILDLLRRKFGTDQTNKTISKDISLWVFKALLLLLAAWCFLIVIFFLKKGIYSLRENKSITDDNNRPNT